MSNYIEYRDSMAFHPGYYIDELIEDSGLTQQDFANRLGTTAKNLSKLINAQQSLSVDMAMKLSRMLGTSLEYWLNLQNAYDAALAQIQSDLILEEEIIMLADMGYLYFQNNYHLLPASQEPAEQVAQVRRFLGVASLTVLKNRDLAVRFRSTASELDENTIAKANALVQIAVNEACKVDAPKFNKARFKAAVDSALTQTTNYDGFYPLVRDAFLEAGVVLVILPDLKGSKINGAAKRIGSSVMLMINDRRLYSDSLWFTLLHEAGHIINGDFGASLESTEERIEEEANRFAEDSLIPPKDYREFIKAENFDLQSIKDFAQKINRDPGIVLGRLHSDGYIPQYDKKLAGLRQKYELVCGI